jgi:hypothetical protein
MACGAAAQWLSGGSDAAIRWGAAGLTRCLEPAGKYVEMPAPFIIVKGHFVAGRLTES